MTDEDSRELAELYGGLEPRVLGLCQRMLGSHAEAEDASQEVFLKAQVGLPGYDRERPFAAWVLRIASHHCIDRIRRRSTEKRIFEPDPLDEEDAMSGEPSPLSQILEREQRTAVRAAIAELPDRYRIPLALRYYADMSYDQISTALGISHGQVATLLFRSKKRLRGVVQA